MATLRNSIWLSGKLLCIGALLSSQLAQAEDRFTVDWYTSHPTEHTFKLKQCARDNAQSVGVSCQNAVKAQALRRPHGSDDQLAANADTDKESIKK